MPVEGVPEVSLAPRHLDSVPAFCPLYNEALAIIDLFVFSQEMCQKALCKVAPNFLNEKSQNMATNLILILKNKEFQRQNFHSAPKIPRVIVLYEVSVTIMYQESCLQTCGPQFADSKNDAHLLMSDAEERTTEIFSVARKTDPREQRSPWCCTLSSGVHLA